VNLFDSSPKIKPLNSGNCVNRDEKFIQDFNSPVKIWYQLAILPLSVNYLPQLLHDGVPQEPSSRKKDPALAAYYLSCCQLYYKSF